MKLFATFAAGAVAVSALFAVAPASAAVQRTVVHERTTVVRHEGPRARARTVCTTRYVHHHRVRRCRTVRR